MHHRNPLRCLRAAYLQAAAAATYQSVALYNDSTGPEMLAVWDLLAGVGGTDHIMVTWSQQGTIGTLIGRGTPIVTGEAPLSGQIWAGNLAAQQTVDLYVTGVGQNAYSGYMFHSPICILRPGWSFVMSNFDQNANFYPSIVWESIPAEKLVKYWSEYVVEAAAG